MKVNESTPLVIDHTKFGFINIIHVFSVTSLYLLSFGMFLYSIANINNESLSTIGWLNIPNWMIIISIVDLLVLTCHVVYVNVKTYTIITIVFYIIYPYVLILEFILCIFGAILNGKNSSIILNPERGIMFTQIVLGIIISVIISVYKLAKYMMMV